MSTCKHPNKKKKVVKKFIIVLLIWHWYQSQLSIFLNLFHPGNSMVSYSSYD